MKKRRRDPRDSWNERDGGSIRRRGFLGGKRSQPAIKRRSKKRESYNDRRHTQALERELRSALRKLPHLRAYEAKNRRAGRKLRKKMRKGSMRDQRILRRVIIEYLLELANTPPYASLN